VARKAKRARIGRRQPPNAELTGRTGACRILAWDKRKFRRWEQQGLVKPALIEPDGVRWYDVEVMRTIAAIQAAVRKEDRRRPREAPPEPEHRRVPGPVPLRAAVRELLDPLIASFTGAVMDAVLGESLRTLAGSPAPATRRVRQAPPSPRRRRRLASHEH
jgi:hypothetical protein